MLIDVQVIHRAAAADVYQTMAAGWGLPPWEVGLTTDIGKQCVPYATMKFLGPRSPATIVQKGIAANKDVFSQRAPLSWLLTRCRYVEQTEKSLSAPLRKHQLCRRSCTGYDRAVARCLAACPKAALPAELR